MGTVKLGDKSAETGSRDRIGGTGQLERTVGTTVAGGHGRNDTTGQFKKTGHDSWDRTTKTGQPRLDNHGRTARKRQLGQDRSQLGQGDQHWTNTAGQP